MSDKNPFIEPENYFAGYQESIDNLKNNPAIVQFDRLCYEVFEATEMGREFIKFAINRFLVNSQVSKGNPTYQLDVIWQEGFRDAYRMILNHIESHKQRIKAHGKE
jgi:hypothetical protein